jgi:hypothetical protein
MLSTIKTFTPVSSSRVTLLAYSFNTVTSDIVCTALFPKFPKLLQAELRTHRSARIDDTSNQSHYSSRAIPIQKALKQVKEDPFVFYLTAFEKGMGGSDTLTLEQRKKAHQIILEMRDYCAQRVEQLMSLGIAKQDCNRYIEPWMQGGCIITFSGNALTHFLDLRTKPGVQEDMKRHAVELEELVNQSKPQLLNPGEWHIPYLDKWTPKKTGINEILKISAARCARQSYENFDGDFTIEKDFELFYKLINPNPPHMTPLEHQAISLETPEQCYTLTGFASQRYLYENPSQAAKLDLKLV